MAHCGRLECPPPPLSLMGVSIAFAGYEWFSIFNGMDRAELTCFCITLLPLFNEKFGNLPYPILLETAIIPIRHVWVAGNSAHLLFPLLMWRTNARCGRVFFQVFYEVDINTGVIIRHGHRPSFMPTRRNERNYAIPMWANNTGV